MVEVHPIHLFRAEGVLRNPRMWKAAEGLAETREGVVLIMDREDRGEEEVSFHFI